jgi:hypothetical protein
MQGSNQSPPPKAPQAIRECSQASTPGKMLTTKDAATFLGLREATLRGWRMNGIGPPFFTMGVTMHRGVRYDMADLEQFKSERRCVPSVRHMGRHHAALQEVA